MFEPGGYRQAEKIGHGTFAEVFKYSQQGTSLAFPKEVACKVLFLSLKTNEQLVLDRELTALRKLNQHEHIIQLFHVGKNHHGQTMFYMELCQQDLHAYSSGRQISEIELRDIALQVGLHYIHKNRIVHRDLKPHNILVLMVNGKAVFKITDFGVAFLFADGDPSSKVSMSAAGTQAYMAPEMLLAQMGETELKGQPYKVDIFSLAVVMFELLHKKTPFTVLQLATPAFDPTTIVNESTVLSDLKEQLLLTGMLWREPHRRPAMQDVVRHRFFTADQEVRMTHAQ